LTSIPAIAGRMLATPCAWGRIKVTVDLAITRIYEATPVPAWEGQQNQVLIRPSDRMSGLEVTCSVR
jgi:hypothetical protein